MEAFHRCGIEISSPAFSRTWLEKAKEDLIWGLFGALIETIMISQSYTPGLFCPKDTEGLTVPSIEEPGLRFSAMLSKSS